MRETEAFDSRNLHRDILASVDEEMTAELERRCEFLDQHQRGFAVYVIDDLIGEPVSKLADENVFMHEQLVMDYLCDSTLGDLDKIVELGRQVDRVTIDQPSQASWTSTESLWDKLCIGIGSPHVVSPMFHSVSSALDYRLELVSRLRSEDELVRVYRITEGVRSLLPLSKQGDPLRVHEGDFIPVDTLVGLIRDWAPIEWAVEWLVAEVSGTG